MAFTSGLLWTKTLNLKKTTSSILSVFLLIYDWSDKSFKDTVLNQRCYFCLLGSLENAFTALWAISNTDYSFSVVLLMVGNIRFGIQSSGILFSLFFLVAGLQSITFASVVRFGDIIHQVQNSFFILKIICFFPRQFSFSFACFWFLNYHFFHEIKLDNVKCTEKFV